MAKTLLCATVTRNTTTELRETRDSQVGADLVELRLDTISSPDVAGALAGRKQPVIVTCRPTWEGGQFTGSEEERCRILLEAMRLGAEYVDVEHRADFASKLIRLRAGQGVVISYHEFDGLPPDLDQRYRAMRSTGAEVVKIAVSVDSLRQSLQMMSLGAGEEGRVLIGMGPAGIPMRVLAGRFGLSWTYAGEAVAPGQIDLDRMCREFAYREISESTVVYGVLGKPIGHSISPAMHNAALHAAGLNAVYLPLEAADIDDFEEFSRGIRLSGVSITAPFKEIVTSRIEDLDPIAKAVGAVNTLRIERMKWVGYNTDVGGFLAPLTERLALKGVRSTVLGAGGAARAVAWGLASKGAVVSVCARRQDQAETLCRELGVRVGAMPPEPGSWDLLVNTTPLGTHPNISETPIPDGRFDGRFVYDLVYNPNPTKLMHQASQAGCVVIGGLEMLVEQARQQFLMWTGVQISADLLAEAAVAALARK